MEEPSAQVLSTYKQASHAAFHHKMPHPPTVTEIRTNNIVTALRLASKLVDELNDALGTSSLQAIHNPVIGCCTAGEKFCHQFYLYNMGFQNVKKNRVECIQLLEDIHGVLYAIINLHLKSDTPGSLAPSMLDHIGNFTEYVSSVILCDVHHSKAD